MPTQRTVICVAALGLWLAIGCSGGGDGFGSDNPTDAAVAREDAVSPYTVTCIETVCDQQRQSCEDAKQQRCDGCYSSCVRSSDPVGCASTCRSVCSGTCTCSSTNDTCARQGVEFLPPPLNEDLYREQLAFFTQCAPETDVPETRADYTGRSYRHEYLDALRCTIAKGCDPTDCGWILPWGTIGDEICARQQSCGQRCDALLDDDSLTADLVNIEEPHLRPALIAQLKRCAHEPTCEVATACWEALQPAVFLGHYAGR